MRSMTAGVRNYLSANPQKLPPPQSMGMTVEGVSPPTVVLIVFPHNQDNGEPENAQYL
jgi:hypothetical protein